MSKKILKYLILLAFVLLVVAISSFWVGGPSFREKDVVFEIEGLTQVSAGDEVTYKIKYVNETRSTLHDLDLNFFFPEGSTVIVDGKSFESYVENFKVDQLASGEKGEKEMRAFIMGDRGNIKVARAVLSFRSGSLTSVFEKTVSLSTTIVSTPISMTLVAPPSTNSNSTIQYILDYRNESDEDASNLIIEFDYPDGFSPVNISPTPKQGNNVWQIELLKKGSGGRITVSGLVVGNEGESIVASAKLRRKLGSDYVDYQKASAATVISNPILGLEITVNNSNDFSATVGDRLNYSIKYYNNSNLSLFGMSLSVKLEGDMFDVATLDTKGGFFDDSTRTITWNNSVIPGFATVLPNSNGKINFLIVLKPAFSSGLSGSSSDHFVRVISKFGTPNVPTGVNSEEVSVSSSLVTRIGTQPTVNLSAYYEDSDFGSSGPLPLKAGEETAFTVHWILTNPGNDIENIKMVSRLASGIEWMNETRTNADQPQPTFNPNTREVTWALSELPYGAGVFNSKYEASFRIKIRPSSTQIGTKPPLMDGVVFSGTDSFTKQSITVSKGGLNADNLVDRPKE